MRLEEEGQHSGTGLTAPVTWVQSLPQVLSMLNLHVLSFIAWCSGFHPKGCELVDELAVILIQPSV